MLSSLLRCMSQLVALFGPHKLMQPFPLVAEKRTELVLFDLNK